MGGHVFIAAALATVVAQQSGSTESCQQIAHGAMEKIEKKLRSAVPFEIVALFMAGETVVCKNPILMRYSLWDESITLSPYQNAVTHTTSVNLVPALCALLTCPQIFEQVGPLRLKLLINPNWSGRLARLRERTASSSGALVSFDWNDIIRSMPAENLIADGEFKK